MKAQLTVRAASYDDIEEICDLSRIEEFSKEFECAAVQLDVMEFNSEAQEFYQALGYETVSRKMAKSI